MGEVGAYDGVGRLWLSFICKELVHVYLDIEETSRNPPPQKKRKK